MPSLTLCDVFAEARGPDATRPVAGLASDSRKVLPGTAFVAIPGTRADGAVFIADAIARGATAIIGAAPRPADLAADIAYVQVEDARAALAQAAARLHPGQPEHVVAVTGTSGKSSVADFTRQLLAGLGRSSASLGTLGLIKSDGAAYGALTTPDPITLHETLDGLAREGVTHLAMEASSHGLEQRRLDGVRLAAAAFTNLGRDHLDYHPTIEDYFAAKLRLFDALLPPGRPAIVNADAPYAARVIAAAEQRARLVLTTGRSGRDIRLVEARPDGFGQRLTIEAGGERHAVLLPLVGGFQVENALVAAGLALALGEEPAAVIAGLGGLKGVPGRLERVGEINGALVIVDYAHKPEALSHVLDSLRPFATGKLVCVFGCGGDRDRGKRPIMGTIAAEKADAVIVTDDNPRSEDPAAIRSEILAAAPGAREIGDRAEAIRAAIRGLGRGDVLVVAGKGHETGQIIGERTLPFSDHQVVRAAIAELS
jgi:UDP-N-acetylmuramoyl-L-alanyl-D-glutamate--2,6-diaminopimelate ligase